MAPRRSPIDAATVSPRNGYGVLLHRLLLSRRSSCRYSLRGIRHLEGSLHEIHWARYVDDGGGNDVRAVRQFARVEGHGRAIGERASEVGRNGGLDVAGRAAPLAGG